MPQQAEVILDVPVAAAHPAEVNALRDVGALFYERGWSVGTSSNYSIRVNEKPLRLVSTASGKDKRALQPADFVVLDENARLVAGPSGAKASAEALLHVAAYELPGVGAVLHTHSVWATLLSDLYFKDGALVIEDYEMLKGLSGVSTHQHRERVEIFDNTQDIAPLASEVRARFAQNSMIRHGYLIRNHGLYTWGRDLAEARRHVEIFEFLFEVLGRKLSLKAN